MSVNEHNWQRAGDVGTSGGATRAVQKKRRLGTRKLFHAFTLSQEENNSLALTACRRRTTFCSEKADATTVTTKSGIGRVEKGVGRSRINTGEPA